MGNQTNNLFETRSTSNPSVKQTGERRCCLWRTIVSSLILVMGIAFLIFGWLVQYPIFEAYSDGNIPPSLDETGEIIGYTNDYGLHHLASTGLAIKHASGAFHTLHMKADVEQASTLNFVGQETYLKELYALNPTELILEIQEMQATAAESTSEEQDGSSQTIQSAEPDCPS